jgi:2,4-dienoyl-CoA reductase-like NADH-dependent reductase (Old Yellow Enzyme family)
MDETAVSNNILQHSLELPCGAILKNRLAKAAMSDSLADGEGNPTEAQIRLYERWAKGGVALSIIGEVQGDYRFPEKPGNLVFSVSSDPKVLQSFARRAVIEGSQLWPQLGHAGALSHTPISRPQGPSALNIGNLQCAEMSVDEVVRLPDAFASTAVIAKEAGFSGVQIHAGHGFLLSQFLSPLFNQRTDGYGGSIEARSRIVIEIINKVRKAVGPSFPIGIKINSTDQLVGGLTQDDALEAVRLIGQTTIDLIDISGGTYFPGAKVASDSARSGPYFLDFAQRARNVTKVPLMATGGFKMRQQAIDAITSGAIDMVGLGRALVLDPQLPKTWSNKEISDPEFPRFQSTQPGDVTAWYTMRITALGEDAEDRFALDVASANNQYLDRDANRCIAWRNKFSSIST